MLFLQALVFTSTLWLPECQCSKLLFLDDPHVTHTVENKKGPELSCAKPPCKSQSAFQGILQCWVSDHFNQGVPMRYGEWVCGEPVCGIPPGTKVMKKEPRQNAKAWSGFRGSPWVFLNIYPRVYMLYCTMLSTLLTFSGKVSSGLQSPAYERNVSAQTPLMASTLPDTFLWTFCSLWIAYSPPTMRGTKLKAS